MKCVRCNMKTLIIDSSNLIYRIWWINKAKNLSSNDDTFTVYMFLRSLRSYLQKYPCDRVISVWDKRLSYPETNFRKEYSSGDYKGTRSHDNVEEVYRHTEKIIDLLESLGVYNMYPDRMEGDDVVAWLSDQESESVIVSADQDMYQLVTATTKVYNPIKKVEVNSVNFEEVTGVCVDSYVLYKSLIGDKSDNIKGLPRVGKKTAIKYISNWDKTIKKLTESDLVLVRDNISLMDLRYGYNYYDTETLSYKKQYQDQENIVYNKNNFLKLCNEHNLLNILKDTNWSACFSHGVEDAVVSVIEALGLQNK